MPKQQELLYHFLNEFDLTEAQIDETTATYAHFADNYAALIERVPDAAQRIQSVTLIPFLSKYKELHLHHPILFVGAGSGRDMQTAESLQLPCVGIDLSASMVNIAKKFGVQSPYFVMDMRHITLPDDQYGGIFCETAISHIAKIDQYKLMRRFHDLLVPGGIVMLGVRIGNGRVFYVDDKVGGRRFNTTMTRPEADAMISDTGFKVLSAPEYPVQDRPSMVDYLLQKPI